MSRTDVHRPWPVQLADPYNRHLLYRYPAWPDRMELTSFRNLSCGCRLCTGQLGRKLGHRRQRTALQAARRAAVKTAPADRDTIDIPAVRDTAW